VLSSRKNGDWADLRTPSQIRRCRDVETTIHRDAQTELDPLCMELAASEDRAEAP